MEILPKKIYVNYIPNPPADTGLKPGLEIDDTPKENSAPAPEPINWDEVQSPNKPEDNATVGATFGDNISGGGDNNTQITNSGYATLFRQDKFGDGSDGDVTISSNTTLTSDMHYDNLTINTGVALNPNGYKIFVKDTLTFLGTGKIISNGGNGNDGEDGNAGFQGGGGGSRANTEGTLPESGVGGSGGKGGQRQGATYSPDNGASGQSFERSCNVNASASGDGGTGLSAIGTAGTIGSNNETKQNPLTTLYDIYGLMSYSTNTYARLSSSCSPGGGGGGAYGAGYNGGGGGGAGSPGGVIMIFAKEIVTVDGNVYVQANGGNGGAGGDGSNDNSSQPAAGGGGGGGGGNGGVAFVIYTTKSGTGTIETIAGTGGAGGSGGINGGLGADGGNGESGVNGTAGFSKLLII